MKVSAKSDGEFKGYRRAGDVFEYDGITEKTVDGKKVPYFPSWMEPVEPISTSKAKAPAKKVEPDSSGDKAE